MRWAAAALLMVSALPANAQSFDCTLAQTTVEKAICDEANANLASRDLAMGQLYSALKEEGGHDGVLAGQSAWLAMRDRCGANADCLEKAYDKRLLVLAREAGDKAGVTGSYHYHLTGEGVTADSDSGDAFVVRQADCTLAGYISTVSGPTYHTCDVSFSDAEETSSGVWHWQGPAEEADSDGYLCEIDVTATTGALRIDSQNCRYYCGARGWFDSDYTRVR